MNEQIMEIKGHGTSKSRPFDVPKHAEFFVVRWTSGDKDTCVSVNGVPPTVCYESFRGRQGDGVVYETGRFYIEVDSDAEWNAVVEVHFAAASAQVPIGIIGNFTGHGPGKTRPFAVPKGSEYFVVTWTTTDKEMDVEVNGIDPTSSYDSFRGGKTGEGLVYESGRFYAEVDTEGSWTLDIAVE